MQFFTIAQKKGCLKATLIYLHPETCVEKQVPNRLIRG